MDVKHHDSSPLQREAFKPLPTWGPADPENRTGRYAQMGTPLPYTVQDEKNGAPGSITGGFENAAYVKSQESVRL